MEEHEKFMNKAIELSRVNLQHHRGGPFGCVIVRNGRIIAEGYNTVVENKDPTCHAEINAIRKACKLLDRIDLSDCVLYTSCCACPMCYAAIHWAKIPKIYYANTRIQAAEIGFKDDHIYQLIENKDTGMQHHMPSDAALDVFRKWYEDEKKQHY